MDHAAPLFFGQFLRAPGRVGAITPSSRALAEAMLTPIDFPRSRVVVEFGPGTGALTRLIAQRLRPGCRYLGIELNAAFHRALTAQFSGMEFEHGSVADLRRILASRGLRHVDAILCGLPWASLPIETQAHVFDAMDRALVPGGLFVTFAYLQGLVLPGARALRQRLHRHFGHVSRSPIIWANVPPAFAYICRRKS